jgi:hypothetical protein
VRQKNARSDFLRVIVSQVITAFFWSDSSSEEIRIRATFSETTSGYRSRSPWGLLDSVHGLSRRGVHLATKDSHEHPGRILKNT